MLTRTDRRRVPDTLRAVLSMATVIVVAIGFVNDARGALIGEYDLTQGAFTNSASGNITTGTLVPQVVSGTGNFTVGGWSWTGATTPGSGLRLENLPATNNGTFSQYTIAVEFAFGQVSGIQRLMWFNASDNGLYVNNNKFAMYGYSVTDNGTLTANTTTNFVVTRAGTGTVTGYQIFNPEAPNPTVNQLFTFNDSLGYLVSPVNGAMEFFRDNDTLQTEFSPSGTASLIKIWDVPLTSDEVKFAFVPEPATVALLSVAGGGAMFSLHRRRRRLR